MDLALNNLQKLICCKTQMTNPSDYSKECSRKRFDSNEEVISETGAYFEAKDKLFYKKVSNC